MAITCQEAAQLVMDAKHEVIGALVHAEHLTLSVAGEVAHIRSSGTATEKMLALPVADGGHGHPYGHGPNGAAGPRGPIPNGGDAGIINIQTGQFASGWTEQYGDYQGFDEIVNRLINETEHAKDLEATPDDLQIRRPIVEGIAALVMPIRLANIQAALDRVNAL
jgi:hypothetical protein